MRYRKARRLVQDFGLPNRLEKAFEQVTNRGEPGYVGLGGNFQTAYEQLIKEVRRRLDLNQERTETNGRE